MSTKRGSQKAKAAGELVFDKYALYRKSVQSPDTDVEFFVDTYKELKGKKPKVMREDFCGTFALSCEWVKLGPKFEAIGVDLDPEPIAYGKEHYLPKLEKGQQKRIELLQANVLEPKLPQADIVIAMNFSYFIFKTRKEIRAYFKSAYKGTKKNGIFLADCFGGSQCYEANEEETVHDDFSYFWDQDNFDPITNYAQFYIHFKQKGKSKAEKVFSYDWRLWTIPEIREIMEEVGFKKTHVYWEGTTDEGEGDGNFTRTEKGEECESWVAYIVGEK